MDRKENKRKLRRLLNSAKYLLRELQCYKWYSVWLPCFCCTVGISLSVCAMFLPKVVLDAVEQRVALEVLLNRVCAVGGLFLTISVMNLILHNAAECCSHNFLYTRLLVLWEKKVLCMDYEIFTSGRGKVMMEKARNAISSPNGGIVEFLPRMTALLEAFAGLVVYCGIIGTLHPAIVLFLLGIFVIEVCLSARLEGKKQALKEERAKTDRKLNYMAYGTKGMQAAKDIRIYAMDSLLREIAQAVLAKKKEVEKKAELWQFHRMLAAGMLILIRDGVAYIYLISRFLNKGMSVGDFTLYFAAITGFGNWLAKLADGIVGFAEASHYVEDFKDFMELGLGEEGGQAEEEGQKEEKRQNEGKEQKEGKVQKGRKWQEERKGQNEGKEQKERKKQEDKGKQIPPVFCFENVSFSYRYEEEGAKKEIPVISNLNLTILPGEKLAVVGVNGAGKSTFVKLLCGMLCPQQGRILADGIDSREWNQEDYYRLFSAVFQNSGFLPVSIAENIMLNIREEKDLEAMWACIRMAGLEEKIKSLPKGADTCLVKRISEEGTELSGGEGQRLLLARALYKNAPVLILDEPTAALDPIAENEIYQRYHQFTEGKTAVFISHRLASTRFCDRILFLENGKILESGTHEELMKLGGRYAEMFLVQSRYYQNDIFGEVGEWKEGRP